MVPGAGEVVGHGTRFHEVTGLDALSPLLAHIDFPTTKQEITAKIGDARIALDKVKTTTVRDIIERTAPETFQSSTDVEAAVQRIWDQLQPHYEGGRGAHHWQRDNVGGRQPN